MNTVLDTLKQVRTLLDDKQSWTRMAFARNPRGKEVLPDAHDATCWCLLGALHKVTATPIHSRTNPVFKNAMLAIRGAAPVVSGQSLFQWNDSTTHEHVISVLDQAIRNEEPI